MHQAVDEKKVLLKQLRKEKKASNVVINNSMAEARTTMSEALRIIREAREMEKVSEDAALVKKDRYSHKVRLERQHSLLELSKAKANAEKRWTEQVEKIHKRHSGALLSKLETKWVNAKKKYKEKVSYYLAP